MRTGVTRAALCAPALLAFVLLPGGALAGEGRKADQPTASTDAKKKESDAAKQAQQAPTVVRPGENGLVVIRDAETGELRAPEGNEAADLLRAVPAENQSDEGLVQVPLPEGGYTVNLQGRFQNYFVVTRQPDGSLKASCVDHPTEAAHQPAPPATPAPQGEDR